MKYKIINVIVMVIYQEDFTLKNKSIWLLWSLLHFLSILFGLS